MSGTEVGLWLAAVGTFIVTVTGGVVAAVVAYKRGQASARKEDAEADGEQVKVEKEKDANAIRRKKENQKLRQVADKHAVDQWMTLCDVLTKRVDALTVKVDQLTDKEARCQVKVARLETKLAEVCERAGVPYPREAETDSGEIDLPPGAGTRGKS